MKTILILPTILLFSAAVHAENLQVDKTKSWLRLDCRATGHTWTSSLKDYQATIAGDSTTLVPSACEFTWNFSNVDSGKADRDSKMLTWLESATHPSGSFKMSKTWKDSKGQTFVSGPLTIHGVSKDITMPVTAAKDGKTVKIDGEVWIDTQNFGLPIIKMIVMSVAPQVRIYFHMEGTY